MTLQQQTFFLPVLRSFNIHCIISTLILFPYKNLRTWTIHNVVEYLLPVSTDNVSSWQLVIATYSLCNERAKCTYQIFCCCSDDIKYIFSTQRITDHPQQKIKGFQPSPNRTVYTCTVCKCHKLQVREMNMAGKLGDWWPGKYLKACPSLKIQYD